MDLYIVFVLFAQRLKQVTFLHNQSVDRCNLQLRFNLSQLSLKLNGFGKSLVGDGLGHFC